PADLRQRPGAVLFPFALVHVDVGRRLARRSRLRSATLGEHLGVDARAGVDAADREVFAQGMAVEALPHQDALQIRMAGEHDAEHVEGLALVPVRRLPYRGDGWNRTLLVGPHAEPHACVLLKRIERVRDAEAQAGVVRELRVVDAREIDEIDEPVVLECAADFDDAIAVGKERDLAGELLRIENRVARARNGGRNERIALDVVHAFRGRRRGCRRGWWWRGWWWRRLF